MFRKFAEAQHVYHAALTDEGQRQESEVYFAEIESSLDFFCRMVNDWLRVTEVRLQDNLVTPDDSASQVGIGLRTSTSLNPLSVDLPRAGSLKQALYQQQEPKRQPALPNFEPKYLL